jgi:hypothetical protein
MAEGSQSDRDLQFPSRVPHLRTSLADVKVTDLIV